MRGDMGLIYKTLESCQRSMYLYFPPIPKHSPYKRCSVTILSDQVDKAAVERMIEENGLGEMARERQLILAFPDPGPEGWDPGRDMEVIEQLQGAMTTERELEPVQTYFGIPTLESMLASWHLMNDTRYLIGIGEKGAAMALAMAACRPMNVAAVMTIGGSLPEVGEDKAVYSPVPVWLCGADAQTVSYFISANGARKESETRWACPGRPLQSVELHPEAELTPVFLNRVWEELFQKVRRTNTGRCGNVAHRTDIGKYGGEYFIEDTRLGDQDNMPHTWLTFVPECVQNLPEGEKAPLLIFYHGGSDNPTEAAEMARFHEIGDREGFITVYPWGSNRCSWNIFMNEDEMDDVAFSEALIRYMTAHYPVDPSRVYLSGFSNGSSQAMVTAMVHPELVAAICPIDGNWPGERIGPSEVDYEQIKPMALARRIQEKKDYRMPVWYTYGTREPSYPVYRGCTQQHQYDFWKRYNHIPVKETPEDGHEEPSGVGVCGDKTEILHSPADCAEHWYSIHRFYSDDPEPMNLYNYVMMHDKGHEVAELDPCLGWEYVKHFRRKQDGSLELI